MSECRLDAVEAARIALTESEALSRALLRAVPATDALERASARFAAGLSTEQGPDGHELLSRYGAAAEALDAAAAALHGVEDALKNLNFAFQDAGQPSARLRARAIEELKAHLDRRVKRP